MNCASANNINHTLPNQLDAQEMRLHVEEDRTDILFRCYDLLFREYPRLRQSLPDNRYEHPDLITLINEDSETGINTTLELLRSLELDTTVDQRIFIRNLHNKILQSIEEVLFESISTAELASVDKILQENLATIIQLSNTVEIPLETSEHTYSKRR